MIAYIARSKCDRCGVVREAILETYDTAPNTLKKADPPIGWGRVEITVMESGAELEGLLCPECLDAYSQWLIELCAVDEEDEQEPGVPGGRRDDATGMT